MHNLTNNEQMIICEALEDYPKLQARFYDIAMELPVELAIIVQDCKVELLAISTLMDMGAEEVAQAQLLELLIRHNKIREAVMVYVRMQHFLDSYFPMIAHNFRQRCVVQAYFTAHHQDKQVIEMTKEENNESKNEHVRAC